MDIDALLKRAKQADQKRQAFAALARDAYAYAMPERDAWNSYGYGSDRHVKVYDSTAVLSVQRFANRLQQALFPPGERWASLVLPPEMAADPEAQQYQVDLQAATEVLFAHLHASNFDTCANEFAQEMAMGHACLLIENGRLGTRRRRAPLLRFQAVPAALVACDEGPFGDVEGVFFRQLLPARLVARHYPDAGELPRALADMAAQEPERQVELLQATTYDAEEDAWRLAVVWHAEKARLVERRYRTCPWVVTRWTKAPGEVYGRGPLTQVLPDVRTVNKLVELALQAGALAVAGVWLALDDGVLNPDTVAIAPGAIIPARMKGALAPLEMPGDYRLSQELRADMISRIRLGMFDDPLPPEMVPGVTATEVIERTRRFQADTGAFGRLQNEAVVPIVRRCIDILEEAGVYAAPRFRDLTRALDDALVRIRPTGPLAMAQDKADAQAVLNFMGQSMQLGDVGRGLVERGLHLDRAAPWLAERLGVPAQLISTDEERSASDEDAAGQAETAQLLASPAIAQLAGAAGRALNQAPAEEAMP